MARNDSAQSGFMIGQGLNGVAEMNYSIPAMEPVNAITANSPAKTIAAKRVLTGTERVLAPIIAAERISAVDVIALCMASSALGG
jgi:hypothetical protein